MKHLEIEKKFLLKPCNIKNLVKKNCLTYQKIKIEQFYLPKKENLEIRYRKEGRRYLKTTKKGTGLVREEDEIEVSKEEYLNSLDKRVGKVVKKVRYEICLDSKVYQIDVYRGHLKGLYTLEIEFKERNEALSYKAKKPFKKLILKDVTDLKNFSNSSLSKADFVEALECVDSCETIEPTNCVKKLLQCYFKDIVKVILKNKEAILLGDKDIEKLHHFRVAIRKIRAVLSLFSHLFSNNLTNDLNIRLKEIMQKSNAKRDVDVYLEALKEYEKILPKELKTAIIPLKEKLIIEQKKEEEKLLGLLNSYELKKAIEDINLLANSESYYTKQAKEMIIVFAKREIKKLSKKIKKDIEKLSNNSPNESFHKLRIKFKKLRYISELLKDIIDIKGFYNFIDELKKYQNILGKHQDLVIQLEYIENFENMDNIYNKDCKEAIEYLKKYISKKLKAQKEEFFKNKKLFKKAYKKAFEC